VAFDPDRFEVRLGHHAVRLTRTQSALLTVLCRHPGHVLPTPLLAAQVPHARTNALGGSLALKAHMSHLRAKLAALPGQPLLLRTYRGQGYGLEDRRAC
jgi:DNA-binding response OmpR family regulator